MKGKTGTYEWSVTTINSSIGCLNNCSYCYARRIALSRQDIKDIDEWNSVLKERRNLDREKRKYGGVVMYPSMHDIFPENLDTSIEVIRNLLEAGNQVLIVSKPRKECIDKLAETFLDYKDRIEFRFSIGCRDQKILSLWEPGAPSFAERLSCLSMVGREGYSNSVSMEPALNPVVDRIVEDVESLLPFVDSIWIGKLNKIDRRVVNIPEKNILRLKKLQEERNVIAIYNNLRKYNKVQWKDSYLEVISAYQEKKCW